MRTEAQLLQHILDQCVVTEDDCWLWQGPLHDGYGQLQNRLLPGVYRVHTAVWRLMRGPVEWGELRTTCGHRHCCNPDHHLDMTHAEGERWKAGDACPAGHTDRFRYRVSKDGHKNRYCRECDRVRMIVKRRDPVIGPLLREQDRSYKRAKR